MREPRATPPPLLGVLLAGGASSRFGSPKWRAELDGATLGARALSALAPNAERIVVVSSDPAVAQLGAEWRPDLFPGAGPLAGIVTALEWAASLELAGVLVLACDLPLVEAPLVRALVDAWCGEDAVVPWGTAGPEPLCALYAVGVRARLEDALSQGVRSPSRILGDLRVRRLGPEVTSEASGYSDPFLNANTRFDLDSASSILRSRDRSAAHGESPAPATSVHPPSGKDSAATG